MMTLSLDNQVLQTASQGRELANRVLLGLDKHDTVLIDVSASRRATTSFANTFIMTLLDKMPQSILRERVRFEPMNPNVASALNRAVQLYNSGVRLSTQEVSAA